jgi:acetylornithine deacetylase/succinyl-diaminopimelate desuccinylase-like protein
MIEDVRGVMASAAYRAALAYLDTEHDRVDEETVALQQIPAPFRQEEAKARAFASMLAAAGLAAEIDQEGNVTALRRGTRNAGETVAIVSHLDTVFAPGTDLSVRREGTRIVAPGIADNTRGVASQVALVRALEAASVQVAADILFVGSVGEEGLGDLRGVKHLLGAGAYKDRITRFIAFDGSAPDKIVHAGVGSRRYDVRLRGPGGHSYSAFGTVSPAFALGEAMAGLGRMRVPDGTTYSVGLVGGGTSVNAIPAEAWMQVDLRSSSVPDLDALEAEMRRLVARAVDGENASRAIDTGAIVAEIQEIGNRPAGRTAADDPLVVMAQEAVAAQGWTPQLGPSSTDANVPMSLGIPAVTIASGVGGRAHSPDEYLDVEKGGSLRVLGVALATLLAAAGLEG